MIWPFVPRGARRRRKRGHRGERDREQRDETDPSAKEEPHIASLSPWDMAEEGRAPSAASAALGEELDTNVARGQATRAYRHPTFSRRDITEAGAEGGLQPLCLRVVGDRRPRRPQARLRNWTGRSSSAGGSAVGAWSLLDGGLTGKPISSLSERKSRWDIFLGRQTHL